MSSSAPVIARWCPGVCLAAATTAAIVLAATPAAAQMRGGYGNHGHSGARITSPRPMSPNVHRPHRGPHVGIGIGGIGLGIGIGRAIAEPEVVRPAPGGGKPPPKRTVTRKGGDGGKPPPRQTATPKGGDGGKPPTQAARGPSGVPPAGEQRYVPDEVVIEMTGSPAEATMQALSARFGLVRLDAQPLALTGTTLYRWRIPDGRAVPEVVRALEGDATIRAAQPNYVYSQSQQAAAAPLPAGGGDQAQYALAKLRLPEAHGLATGDSVMVAVIDSGVDIFHPELYGVVAASYDALETKDGPHQHGTGVAGIIAAHARLKGAAPKVKILAVRAFAAGKGSTFSVVKGLDWAASQDARVINMSFTGPSDPALSRTLDAARQKGAILVAAAGNGGPKAKPLYPAAADGVIAVTATDAQDRLFTNANRGSYVAVAAPGVDILMPSTDGGYWVSTGTSMAAAYVSGVAALVLERQPRIDGEALRKLLSSTARDLGAKGRDDEYGAGLIDAYQAIMAVGARTSDVRPAGARR